MFNLIVFGQFILSNFLVLSGLLPILNENTQTRVNDSYILNIRTCEV